MHCQKVLQPLWSKRVQISYSLYDSWPLYYCTGISGRRNEKNASFSWVACSQKLNKTKNSRSAIKIMESEEYLTAAVIFLQHPSARKLLK